MSINPENASAVAAPYSRAQKVYVRNVIIELFGAMRELSLKQFLTDDMYLFFVTMIEEVLLARTNATNGRAFKAKIDLVRSFVNQNGRPFRASVEQVEAAIADGTVPRTYVMVNGRAFEIDPVKELAKIRPAKNLLAKFRAELDERAGSESEEGAGADPEASVDGAPAPVEAVG